MGKKKTTLSKRDLDLLKFNDDVVKKIQETNKEKEQLGMLSMHLIDGREIINIDVHYCGMFLSWLVFSLLCYTLIKEKGLLKSLLEKV